MFRIRLALSIFSLLFTQLILADSIERVSTTAGTYIGHDSDYAEGVTVFQGMAFAAPPVRDLRWQPPAEPISFAGARQADRAGPACWQVRNGDNTVYARGNLNRSEDCLYLNVYTAAQDSEERLPVMVWFHGGSNTAGHGGALIFDGSNLAARGAVVVTANYRLGPFGFLSHPALTNESEQRASGNYGLMDQIEALRWVQENIAGFGGDADRVTIFGQSAGGEDVCLLMASPQAANLFSGVIGQSPSGGCMRLQRGLEGDNGGHARGERFISSMGITGDDAEAVQEMRELPPQQIIGTVSSMGNPNGPIVDGWVLPDTPQNLFESGRFNRVPVMMGALSDEYFGLNATDAAITAEELEQGLNRVFGSRTPEILTAYADLVSADPLAARKTVMGDRGFMRTARDWARAVRANDNPAYVYYFSRAVPAFRLYVPAQPDLNNDGGQRTLGAYHSGELAYVFNNTNVVGIGWDDQDHALSDTVADYWFNFAATGNPNGPGLPQWNLYDADADAVQILDTDVRHAEHPRKQYMDLIDNVAAP